MALLRSTRHRDALRHLAQVRKRSSPGERVIGSIFPSRGSGYPGYWYSDRIQQVYHYRNWQYVCIDLYACKIASIIPNMAYSTDRPVKGRTVKACQRSTLNLTGRGFGGEPYVGAELSKVTAKRVGDEWRNGKETTAWGNYVGASGWNENAQAPVGFSGGGHSFMTMGEWRSKALSVVDYHENLEPLDGDHRLRRLVMNPNPVDTWFDLSYEAFMYRGLTGVSYLWAPKNSYGLPCELWCIPSHWVYPRTGAGQYVPFNHEHADELVWDYEIRPWGYPGYAGVLHFPPDEVIVQRAKHPLSKIDGYSKLAAGAQVIDLEEATTQSQWSQMINQAQPGMIVKLPPGYEDPDDSEIARMEAKFFARVQGAFNYGRPMFAPSGADVMPWGYNPTDMAYQSGQDQARDRVLALWKVPKSAIGMAEGMTYGSIMATLGQICLDQETECLTADGWKKHGDIDENTLVACYDASSSSMVYHRPTHVRRQQYNGPMHYWLGDRVDAAMTPGHRVYTRRFSPRPHLNVKMPWRTSFVSDLTPSTTYRILRAAPVLIDIFDEEPFVNIESFDGYRQREKQSDHVISADVWLGFLGTFLSEGHMHRGKPDDKGSWIVGMTQHPCSPKFHDPDVGRRRFAKMREQVMATPFNWKEREGGSGCVVWETTDKGLYDHLMIHCGDKALNKRIPSYVKAWSEPHLRVLLDSLIAGDGSVPRMNENTGVWNSQYQTSSRQLADDVMEIGLKCGLAASINVRIDEREEYKGRERYFINLSDRLEVCVLPSHRTLRQYSGDIWCVEVPTHLFFVRRNGKAHVTGNCVFGINPELTASGLTMTKFLASKFDERLPAYSTMAGGGHGGGEQLRRCKLWYDDCVPADPQQVNSDLGVDMQAYAVTPNEVRALRGRQPFRRGGDNPIVQGPGGPMPLVLNAEENVDDMAEIIARMTQAEGKETGEQQADDVQVQTEGKVDAATVHAEGEEDDSLPGTQLSSDDHGGSGLEPPEKPNGKPSKAIVTEAEGDKYEVRPVQVGGKQLWQVLCNGKVTDTLNTERGAKEQVAYYQQRDRENPSWNRKSLDRLGGEDPDVSAQSLATADFVTLPKGVEGTNCSNCLYQKGKVCQHQKLKGQKVNDRNCCILPGALVAGVFVAGSKAWYSGEAIRIVTGSGRVVSLTINHPVLTEHGFVAAGQINDGDELVSYRFWENAPSTSDNVHNQPSIVEKVFESLLSCWSDTAREEGTASLDFHGDGQFIKGDVQIVRADGLLRCARNTDTSQDINDWGLSDSDFGKRPLSSYGGQQHRLVTTRTVSGRIVSGLDLSLPFFDCHRIPDSLCGSGGDSRTPASFLGSQVGVPFDERRNCLLYSPAYINSSLGEISSEDSVVGVVEPSNFSKAFARQVKLDQVIEVVRFHYDGPVYDLETDTGFIIAGGILISNCSYWDNDEALRTWRGEKSLKWLHPAVRKQQSIPLVTSFPDVRQDNHYECGAACFAAVCQCYGIDMTVGQAAKLLGTNVQKSTDPQVIVRELRKLGIAAQPRKGMTVEQLRECTDAGHPVICCLQDYGGRREAGASFEYGHYMVALEASHGVVIFQDPSIENVEREPGGDTPRSEADRSGNVAMPGRVVLDAAKLVGVWHDQRANGEKLEQFGIVCGPKTQPGKQAKRAGTCEPGQTATRTGCTPASGEGGEHKPVNRIKDRLSKSSHEVTQLGDEVESVAKNNAKVRSAVGKAYDKVKVALRNVALGEFPTWALDTADLWMFEHTLGQAGSAVGVPGAVILIKAAAWGAAKAWLTIRKARGKSANNADTAKRLHAVLSVVAEAVGFEPPNIDEIKAMLSEASNGRVDGGENGRGRGTAERASSNRNNRGNQQAAKPLRNHL